MRLKHKEKISKDIIEILGKNQDPYSPFFELFLGYFTDHLSSDYISKLNRQEFVTHITQLWDHFVQRKNNEYSLDLHHSKESNKVNHLFLTITCLDRPYLVDSLKLLFSKWGLKTEMFIHPVLFVLRSQAGVVERIETTLSSKEKESSGWHVESVMYLKLKSLLSPSEIEEFMVDLKTILNQLVWVNEDRTELLDDISIYSTHLKHADLTRWSKDDIQEAQSFLSWTDDQNFIFLGSRYFSIKTSSKEGNFFCLEIDPESLRGIFRAESIQDADDLVPYISRAKVIEYDHLTSEKNSDIHLVRVSKTNQRSNIARSSRIESIEVLDFDTKGKIRGIYQYVGIFRKILFTLSSFDVPLIRQKAKRVFDQFGLEPTWHDGRVLLEILESIPRDEMFYLSESQIFDICIKVFKLRDEGGVNLFSRVDPFGRYETVVVYLSRERFSQQLKDRFGEVLAKEMGGTIASDVVQLGDLPFARIIYVVEFESPSLVRLDEDYLVRILQDMSLTWLDHLENYLEKETQESDVAAVLTKYRRAFPVSYQEQFKTEEVYDDICVLNKLNDHHPINIEMYFQKRTEEKSKNARIESVQGKLKIKIYHYGKSLLLSDLLPILSNLGIRVLSETTHVISLDDHFAYIHDFDVSLKTDIRWLSNLDLFKKAFLDVWHGKIENDGFNQLVLSAGLQSRQVNVLRTYVKYLLQARLPYSQAYVENALSSYPRMAYLLVEYFEARFRVDPSKQRTQEAILSDINQGLNTVSLLDHDKIMRRIMNVMECTLRTNYFQEEFLPTGELHSKSYLSIKLDSQKVLDLPSPRPLYEIFVYSVRVEAIHLRGGKVARGGIRWSDRFEDFRTEVLGLMKAQMVKNSVIIPVGSKGGFIVKRQHQLTDRNEVLEEAIECYKIFMRGMLDITDNLVEGHVVPPVNVVRYDQDDPYLVVAADKGTASFSDIANAISQEYKFWLDDAFASGGSAGYDHKKMAITSRGAWESVKRHFREMGMDVQMEPFTVAGIGDMSGDVFGNGMLRSEKICLVFAFDHRHIFIDPHPNPRHSFLERKRLFELPRSSWADYNKDILSKGGGIYSRSEKLIHISPEAQALLGLKGADNTPDDVVRAILCSQVDLLWFGGIGTFVKGSQESNVDVGDMGNAGVRIDGKMIRAKVVGEGANLGMTQRGRIEYALEGGRINTDAIDNSAGVDCSDHEVNIKILYSSLKTPLSREKRNEMLVSMTDDVAYHVLQNNYDQTRVLSFMRALGENNIGVYQDVIKTLETEIGLNRALEFLPDEETYERRKFKGQGMTRPELAIILAYSKMCLQTKLIQSKILDDPSNQGLLISYFPELLQNMYEKEILNHPLRREILATLMANNIINRVGPTFVYELCQVSGYPVQDVVNAFFEATRLLDLVKIWDEIDRLDSMMLWDLQIKAYMRIAQTLKIAVLRILDGSFIQSKEIISEVIGQLAELIEGSDKQTIAREMYTLQEKGLSFQTIEKLVVLPYLNVALDLATLDMGDSSPLDVASIYFRVRSHFNLDLLNSKTLSLDVRENWQRIAQLGLLDDISRLIIELTQNIVNVGGMESMGEWVKSHEGHYKQSLGLLSHLEGMAHPDIGLLTYAVRQLQRIPQIKRISA